MLYHLYCCGVATACTVVEAGWAKCLRVCSRCCSSGGASRAFPYGLQAGRRSGMRVRDCCHHSSASYAALLASHMRTYVLSHSLVCTDKVALTCYVWALGGLCFLADGLRCMGCSTVVVAAVSV